MNETCDMTFKTSLGRTRVVRIPNPLASLPANVVTMAAGRIMTANPFDATVGTLVELKRADRVSVSEIVLI